MTEEEMKKVSEHDEMIKKIHYLEDSLAVAREEKEKAYLHGMIDGLKFSIRCNGVSGNDVQ